MENKRRLVKFFTALVTLAVVATMCVLLVACDPDGKKGEDSTGGGDAIFTEGVTLAELTEKLNAAESFRYEQYFTSIEEELGYDTYVYKYIPHAYAFVGTYHYFGDDDVTVIEEQYESYVCASGDYSYISTRGPENVIESSKTSAEYVNGIDEERVFCYDFLNEYLTEKDGKIVFDEERLAATDESYVTGSGYVKLSGTSIEVGCSFDGFRSGMFGIGAVKYVISDVNATTVTIPDYIKAAEKDAVWWEEF